MLAMVLLNRMSMKRRQAAREQAVKKVEMEKKDVTEYCRTCLSKDDLVLIFYNAEGKEKRTEELRLVTGLEIAHNDGLSQKICAQCVDTVTLALQFRRVSKKAEKALLHMTKGTTKVKRKSSKLQKALKSPKLQSIQEFDYKNEIDEKSDKLVEDFSYSFDDDQFMVDDFQNEADYTETDGQTAAAGTSRVKPGRKRGPAGAGGPAVGAGGPVGAGGYKCATCDKEFRMRATYKAHMRFHTNYCVCESCGKRCRNYNQLQEHKRARHGLGKIHKCAYCEYSSATKEALTIHERRHTGERPYVCDHCGAAFHRRSNLVQHIAIHLPHKNFQCPLCPKREKSAKLLTIHQYKAHRAHRYRYLCPACGASFSRPGNVRQHLARAHRVPRGEQGAVTRVQTDDTASPGTHEQQTELVTDGNTYLFLELDNTTI